MNNIEEKNIKENNVVKKNNKEMEIIYKGMLEDIVNVRKSDNAFNTINRHTNFDLKNYISDENYKQIFTESIFRFPLSPINIESFISEFEKAKTVDKLLLLIDEYNIKLSMSERRFLASDFENEKPKIIRKIKRHDSKTNLLWLKFKNKYTDIQAQNNVWPLFVATAFIKIKTDTISVCAPLLLKKAAIEIEHGVGVFLKSLDYNVEYNEKLFFLLKEMFGLDIMNSIEDGESSFKDMVEDINIKFPEIQISFNNLSGEYDFGKKKPKNDEIITQPGITLSMFSPTGGALKDRMINVIKNKDDYKLLDVDESRNIKKETMEDMQNLKGIYRITPTDISQEQAIIGSLKDSSIIWGPPGTGKSQTICNILANIMYHKKITLITSEKKAALDVIKERMGKLSKYAFFGLIDKHMSQASKKEFYKPFQELINLIDVNVKEFYKKSSPYLTKAQIEFAKQKQIIKSEKVSDVVNVVNFLSYNNDIHNKIEHIHRSLKSHANIIDEYRLSTKSIDDIVDSKGWNLSRVFFRRKPRLLRNQIKNHIKNLVLATRIIYDDKALYSLSRIKNIQTILDIPLFRRLEIQYIKSDNKFQDDTDFLDRILANRFKYTIKKLIRRDKSWEDKIELFRKHAKAGYRIPYKFINIHKELLSEIFLVFVSTPQTIAQITHNIPQFDYAIFDEASQLRPENGIPFIATAKINIIVGDKQQMAPSTFFVSKSDNKLEGSLLDYAYDKGLKPSREYMLNKNYRSKVGELMLFSSKEFYESNLDVIDDRQYMGHEAIEVINVGGKWEGRINKKETIATLNKILEIHKKYSSIILLTLNKNQQEYMLNMVYDEEYKEIGKMIENDKLKLRNLENIQGDEAEVVVISVAYDKNARLSASYVARPEGRNALNVAISRAQKKIIIFKSISYKEVKVNINNKSMMTFRNWLEYLDFSSSKRKKYLDQSRFISHENSINKKSYIDDIYRVCVKGIELDQRMKWVKNLSIGSFTLDVAIVDNETNEVLLSLEAIRYGTHDSLESALKDIERKKFLEAKRYPVYSITELNWKFDKKIFIKTISEIVSKIKDLKNSIEIALINKK